MKSIITIILLFASMVYSQNAYKIPFSSKDNSIELTIRNGSAIKTKDINVKITDKPAWVKFDEESKSLEVLEGSEEKAVEFKFSVDKTAPVGEQTILKFEITDDKGESWEKEIAIEVSPPTEFKLYQNYPNPFNPSTTIEYTIPSNTSSPLTKGRTEEGLVTLKIYDILGREVTTLVNQHQKPGFYRVAWNAGNYASGMYIYQLITKDGNGKIKIQRKKMLLMK